MGASIRSGDQISVRRRRSSTHLYGEAVAHHHDHQWDEEGHKGANQHEALLVHNTAAVHKHLVLVVEADDRDGHGHTWREGEGDGGDRGEREGGSCQGQHWF